MSFTASVAIFITKSCGCMPCVINFCSWFPDYYDDIANPISMTQIKRKIKRRKYISLNEMAADMNLMFENAKEYNADESKIFQVSYILLTSILVFVINGAIPAQFPSLYVQGLTVLE